MSLEKTVIFAMALGVSAIAMADTCLVPPVDNPSVGGRFGKFRAPGAFSSGSKTAHMHDGFDFSTGGAAKPIYATTDGKIIYADLMGSAGNTIIIERANGEKVAYYHLSSFASINNRMLKIGDTVTAGQEIGKSGMTGMGPGGRIHLHFIYGVAQADDVRAKQYEADAVKNKAFDPSQLPTVLKHKNHGFATDPAPYFCQTFPIQNDGLYPVLGSDTKQQHSILFGSTPSMGVAPTSVSSTEVAAANGDALIAADKGGSGTVASVFSDAEGYGSLPSMAIGDYTSMSPTEMVATEATRRFSSAKWQEGLVKVTTRALWADYVKAMGVSAYMNAAVRQRKERVEALLAVYTATKLAQVRDRVTVAQEQATKNSIIRQIQ